MNEAQLLRTLRQYRRVRGPDFHEPPTRSNGGRIGDGSEVDRRHPLSKQERLEAEKRLAAGEDGRPGAEETPIADEEAAAGKALGLIDPADFFKHFDAWIDSKYPGDRSSATKVKVGFRKQHRATVAGLCLESIEDIAQAVQ